MQVAMTLQQAHEDTAIITLAVPMKQAMLVADTIKDMLSLAGHRVSRTTADGEELISANAVFPDCSPAMALKSLRGKEGINQQGLAQRLGIRPNMLSDMESGKRPISLRMAKHIAEVFNISHKVFL